MHASAARRKKFGFFDALEEHRLSHLIDGGCLNGRDLTGRIGPFSSVCILGVPLLSFGSLQCVLNRLLGDDSQQEFTYKVRRRAALPVGTTDPLRAAAERAHARGVTVIMNRCPRIEFQRLFGGPQVMAR